MAKKRVRLTDENDPLTQTDQVLQGIANLSASDNEDNKSASQQADKLEKSLTDLSEAPKSRSSKSVSQQVNLSEGQQVDKLALKKATFQLSDDVLQELDRLHLKLQLDMGKSNAPYKEVLVEEAIASFLTDFEHQKEEKMNALTVRQNKR